MASITPTNMKFWTNRHETFTQPIDNLFDIQNGNTGNVLNDYNDTTVTIQSFLTKAIRGGKSLRVLGSGWSFTKVATTDGWILNTKHLNFIFNVSQSSIAATYTGPADQLVFAQCGTSILELNRYLRSVNKSLKTSGASNGQTIVGALSTGTHGAAIDVGSVQDFVVGLHIITSPDTSIWLERASHPVVADGFAQKLQAQLVRNDDWFNAALVSFGSFGFIHGVLIETTPLYLLESYRQLAPLDDKLKHIMETLDFSQANNSQHGNERPFHFQSVVNPYDLAAGAYVTLMYKRKYHPDYQPPVSNNNVAGPGDDAASFIGKLTNVVPSLIPILVNKLTRSNYITYAGVLGTSGEIFNNTTFRGKVLSTAMAIPISWVNKVNELLIELNKKAGPFPGVFSYRYVKGTQALLGFTKFDPCCVLELDGVQGHATQAFYEAAWQALENAGVPYTFHWGKVNNLTANRIAHMYGDNRIKWIAARNAILPPQCRTLFTNQLLKDWQLDVANTALHSF